MNVAQPFLLLMWVITGLCLVLVSPSRRFRKEVGGLSNAEVSTLLRQKDQGLTLGCRRLPGLLLESVQTIVVEPVYLLWGLLAHVGQKEFAYGALAAVLVNVLLSIVAYIIRKARSQFYPKITWSTWIWTCIASLPTLYLWYLFFVVVGVAR
ncbi:MAG TPA: hypothetical protein VKR06_34765 [Ktedonosporobacter sp.]|nr:hypothetical protein [Ktedonosporobacter sp.]